MRDVRRRNGAGIEFRLVPQRRVVAIGATALAIVAVALGADEVARIHVVVRAVEHTQRLLTLVADLL
jgi:hypothetical protein